MLLSYFSPTLRSFFFFINVTLVYLATSKAFVVCDFALSSGLDVKSNFSEKCKMNS